MIQRLIALSELPLLDTCIASNEIANLTPFVASNKSATALTQQPQQNPQPDQLPQQPSVSVLNVQATVMWKRP